MTQRPRHADARVGPADKIATPDDWAAMLDRAPILRAEVGLQSRVLIRRWRDTFPDMRQPPLDHHYVALHLGAHKRVRRRGGDGEQVVEVDPGAISIVSAGAAYQWRTEGAIDYAHIYVPPGRLTLVAAELFGRDEPQIQLIDAVGVQDDLLSQLFQALLVEGGGASTAFTSTAFTAPSWAGCLRAIPSLLPRRARGRPSPRIVWRRWPVTSRRISARTSAWGIWPPWRS